MSITESYGVGRWLFCLIDIFKLYYLRYEKCRKTNCFSIRTSAFLCKALYNKLTFRKSRFSSIFNLVVRTNFMRNDEKSIGWTLNPNSKQMEYRWGIVDTFVVKITNLLYVCMLNG